MKTHFALDEPLKLPPAKACSRHVVHPFTVVLLPGRPTWIVLTDEELLAFDILSQGATVRDAVNQCGKAAVSQTVAKIHHAKFYAVDSSRERQLPWNLTLNLTNKCNLRCRHCYADAGMALPNELSLGTWLDVFAQFHGLSPSGEVTLTGGEPTLFPHFWEVASAVKRQGHRLVVFTNGTTLKTQADIGRLCHLADVVQLSLDGLTAETNDAIRGKGVWESVHTAFKNIYSTSVQIRLSVCITPDNAAEIASHMVPFMQAIDPARKVGVIFSPTLAAGRNSQGKLTVDYPTVQDIIGNQLFRLWQAGWRRPNTFQRNERFSRCGIGSTAVVDAAGGLHSCTFAPATGNILKNSLADWRAEEAARLQTFRVESHPKCSLCDLRYICRGGCWISSSLHPCGASPSLCDHRNRAFYWDKIVVESLATFPTAPNATQKGGE